ncbi:VOC family protein [Natrinema soli]|uniref:VOC family protein n=1 Tax=Natrinema soli TaxID=1930624 RepID=A0ABD5SL23_9EURY|nr:VOC family protein [Natrinema soli]
MTHAINWFEIPVTEYDRAVEFYSMVLDREIDEYDDGEETEGRYGIIRTEEGEIGGAIAQIDSYTPDNSETTISYTPDDDSGTIVYLAVERDLNDALSAVGVAGGEVLVEKQDSDAGGYFAFVRDTEGNRIGLMSAE